MRPLNSRSTACLAMAGAVLMLGSAPALAAGPAEDSATLAQAQSEGTLTLYTVFPIPENQKMLALFKKEHPDIKVNLIREGTGPLDERYASEAKVGATAADIIIQPSEPFVEQAAANGWAVPLTADMVPAAKDWPQKSVHGTYADIMFIPWGIEYNTDLVKTPPTSYADIADPSYKGRLILVSPLNGSPESVGWQQIYNTYGADLLKKYAAQSPTYVASIVPAAQGVASGQYAAAVFNQPGADAALVAKGAPVKFVLPMSTSAFPQYLMISAKGPHPAAARVFANFLMTRDGQAALCNGNGMSALGKDIPCGITPPAHLWIGDTIESAKHADEYANLIGERP